MSFLSCPHRHWMLGFWQIKPTIDFTWISLLMSLIFWNRLVGLLCFFFEEFSHLFHVFPVGIFIFFLLSCTRSVFFTDINLIMCQYVALLFAFEFWLVIHFHGLATGRLPPGIRDLEICFRTFLLLRAQAGKADNATSSRGIARVHRVFLGPAGELIAPQPHGPAVGGALCLMALCWRSRHGWCGFVCTTLEGLSCLSF